MLPHNPRYQWKVSRSYYKRGEVTRTRAGLKNLAPRPAQKRELAKEIREEWT